MCDYYSDLHNNMPTGSLYLSVNDAVQQLYIYIVYYIVLL